MQRVSGCMWSQVSIDFLGLPLSFPYTHRGEPAHDHASETCAASVLPDNPTPHMCPSSQSQQSTSQFRRLSLVKQTKVERVAYVRLSGSISVPLCVSSRRGGGGPTFRSDLFFFLVERVRTACSPLSPNGSFPHLPSLDFPFFSLGRQKVLEATLRQVQEKSWSLSPSGS